MWTRCENGGNVNIWTRCSVKFSLNRLKNSSHAEMSELWAAVRWTVTEASGHAGWFFIFPFLWAVLTLTPPTLPPSNPILTPPVSSCCHAARCGTSPFSLSSLFFLQRFTLACRRSATSYPPLGLTESTDASKTWSFYRSLLRLDQKKNIPAFVKLNFSSSVL